MSLALHEAELAQYVPEAMRARVSYLGMIAGQIDAMATSVRRISADLRPPVLDDLGLDAAIEWMAENFEQRYGVLCGAKSLLKIYTFMISPRLPCTAWCRKL